MFYSSTGSNVKPGQHFMEFHGEAITSGSKILKSDTKEVGVLIDWDCDHALGEVLLRVSGWDGTEQIWKEADCEIYRSPFGEPPQASQALEAEAAAYGMLFLPDELEIGDVWSVTYSPPLGPDCRETLIVTSFDGQDKSGSVYKVEQKKRGNFGMVMAVNGIVGSRRDTQKWTLLGNAKDLFAL